jgi:U3 small nucleolar RNA-associated protein 14
MQLKDYFVNKLPHNVKSSEQFDYLQSEPIGPEWNTLTQFGSNIKPKVITKAGHIIEAIRLPKSFEKKGKN